MIISLKELGLNSYEAAAYEALVKYGAQTASTTAKKSNVPHPRIFDILRSLADKGLVLITKTKPMMFKAINPDIALNALAEKKSAHLKNSALHAIEDLSKLEFFGETGIIEKVDITAGYEALWESAKHMVKNAKKSLKSIATYEKRPISFMREIYSASKRGIDVRYVVTRKSKAIDLFARKDIKHGLKVRCYNTSLEKFRITIADDVRCLITIVNPIDRKDRVNIYVENKELSKALSEFFDKIWKKSRNIK